MYFIYYAIQGFSLCNFIQAQIDQKLKFIASAINDMKTILDSKHKASNAPLQNEKELVMEEEQLAQSKDMVPLDYISKFSNLQSNINTNYKFSFFNHLNIAL